MSPEIRHPEARPPTTLPGDFTRPGPDRRAGNLVRSTTGNLALDEFSAAVDWTNRRKPIPRQSRAELPHVATLVVMEFTNGSSTGGVTADSLFRWPTGAQRSSGRILEYSRADGLVFAPGRPQAYRPAFLIRFCPPGTWPPFVPLGTESGVPRLRCHGETPGLTTDNRRSPAGTERESLVTPGRFPGSCSGCMGLGGWEIDLTHPHLPRQVIDVSTQGTGEQRFPFRYPDVCRPFPDLPRMTLIEPKASCPGPGRFSGVVSGCFSGTYGRSSVAGRDARNCHRPHRV